jgi:hypothetical protein
LNPDTTPHRALAVRFNNAAWDLLEQPTRGPEEDARMLYLAGAAFLHWQQAGGALEEQRARHLLASVHGSLGQAALAQHQAEALAARSAAGLPGETPFDGACVAEAMVRALRLAGRDTTDWQARAEAAAAALSEEDRPFFVAMMARP